mmetsp:Transcript_6094/g.19517  ORF Transcript_6094/g.19517 Transcript_6094/m.19517 type:complete len:303 (+) Transcript_6094:178-1086(+)
MGMGRLVGRAGRFHVHLWPRHGQEPSRILERQDLPHLIGPVAARSDAGRFSASDKGLLEAGTSSLRRQGRPHGRREPPVVHGPLRRRVRSRAFRNEVCCQGGSVRRALWRVGHATRRRLSCQVRPEEERRLGRRQGRHGAAFAQGGGATRGRQFHLHLPRGDTHGLLPHSRGRGGGASFKAHALQSAILRRREKVGRRRRLLRGQGHGRHFAARFEFVPTCRGPCQAFGAHVRPRLRRRGQVRRCCAAASGHYVPGPLQGLPVSARSGARWSLVESRTRSSNQGSRRRRNRPRRRRPRSQIL